MSVLASPLRHYRSAYREDKSLILRRLKGLNCRQLLEHHGTSSSSQQGFVEDWISKIQVIS